MAGKSYFLTLLFLVSLLSSCSSVSRKEEAGFESALRTGNLSLAKKMIKSGEFLSEEKSRLLHLMELGTIYHLRGEYKTSLLVFEQAHTLSKKLFTKSISKKVSTFLSNDSADNYYGTHFERSMIRYYQDLNHYRLSSQGFEEKRFSNPLAHIKKTDGKKKLKVLKVQEVIIEKKELNASERRSHLMAARAAIIDWDSYLSQYEKELKGKPVYKKDLVQMLFGSLIHKKVGTRSDKGVSKVLLKQSDEVLFKNYNLYPMFNNKSSQFIKDYKKLSSLKKNHGEVSFILNEGFVSKRSPYKVDFPIGFNTLTYSSFSKGDFISYVRKVLAFSGAGNPTISFELPSMPLGSSQNELTLVIKDEAGAIVKESELSVIHPLSDIAKRELAEGLPAIKKKVAARLVGKHLSALVASYVAYRAMEKKGKGGLGLLMSTASYYIANKGIQSSEKADLRHWRSLPSNIRMTQMRLPFGKYVVEVINKVTGSVKVLNKFSLNSDHRNLIYSQRLF